jgi:phosphatidylserine/phosphatidylglycerophosphate/cardiolipin synthase-like enzyme
MQDLEHIFDQDRHGDPIDMAEIDPRIIICPLNCRYVIEDMIKKSTTSIDIMTQYIVDDQLISLLKKTDPDISLRMLLSTSDSNRDMVEYFGDQKARIYDYKSRYLHTKTLLVDNKRLLI